MLMRYDPFRELDRLTSSLFDAAQTPRTMPMDAYRQGDDLHVHLDLPGVEPDSIELMVEKNVLSVTARRHFDRTESEELIVSERPQGVFSRQIFLGEGLDTDALEANYTNGVLTINVPVLESAKPRRVPIEAAGGTRKAIEAGGSTTDEQEQVTADSAA